MPRCNSRTSPPIHNRQLTRFVNFAEPPLTSVSAGLKYRAFQSGCGPFAGVRMNSIRPIHSPEIANQPLPQPCRHPRVQIVSRDEDAEFVECLECREIFESSEFKDMDIEERILPDA